MLRRRVGLRGRGRPHPPAVSHHPARPVGLVGRVGPALRPQLLLQAALGSLSRFGRERGIGRCSRARSLSSPRCASRSHFCRPWRGRDLRRQARRRAPRRRARPRRRRSRSPPRRSRARSARNRRSRRGWRWPATFVPSIATTPTADQASPARTTRAPRRTSPPAPAGGARRTARSSRDRAAAAPRSPETRRPPRTPARSPATTASRARRRRATAPPSSPAHRPAGRARPRDRPHRTPPDPSRSTASITNHAK